MRRVKDLLFLVLCLPEFQACLVFSLDAAKAFGAPGAARAKPTILNPRRSQPGILWDEGVEPGALPRLSSSWDVLGFAGWKNHGMGGKSENPWLFSCSFVRNQGLQDWNTSGWDFWQLWKLGKILGGWKDPVFVLGAGGDKRGWRKILFPQ